MGPVMAFDRGGPEAHAQEHSHRLQHILAVPRSLDCDVLTPNSVLRRKNLVSHELGEDNQLALFDSTKKELVIVNDLGRVVWTLLDGETSLAEIAKEISGHVSGAPSVERVEVEVLEFARVLLDRDAVECVNPPPV